MGKWNADMATQKQINQYRDLGYFIVNDFVEKELLEELADGAQRVITKARSGDVVDDENCIGNGGKGEEPRFVNGIIAPEFGEPAFAEYIGSEPISHYLRPFLGVELRFGMVHLCGIRGEYHGGWHRDIGGHDCRGNYEVEMQILTHHRKNFMKCHRALIDEPCLWIVPRSHSRYRTDLELGVLNNDGQGEIAKAVQIHLGRGDTIFWNGNTIHRGRKPLQMGDRLTLMCALINHHSAYDPGEKGDQGWLLADNIRNTLPETTKRYYDNWRSIAERRMAVAVRE